MEQKKIISIALAVGLFFMSALAFFDVIDPIINGVGVDKIHKANAGYLEDALNKSVKGFLVLSSIKSGLAIIEDSSVGIGFSLQIGDIVQSVYDFVDIAWKTTLAGSTVLLLTRLILNTIYEIDHYFLCLAFLITGISITIRCLFPAAQQTIRSVRALGSMLAIVTFSLYLLLPGSIALANYLSGKISQSMIKEAHDGFLSIQEDFSAQNLNNLIFPKRETEESLADAINIAKQYNKAKQALKQTADWFKSKVTDISMWTLQLITGYLFDCILFPLTFIFILFAFNKSIIAFVLKTEHDNRLENRLIDKLNILSGKLPAP